MGRINDLICFDSCLFDSLHGYHTVSSVSLIARTPAPSPALRTEQILDKLYYVPDTTLSSL